MSADHAAKYGVVQRAAGFDYLRFKTQMLRDIALNFATMRARS